MELFYKYDELRLKTYSSDPDNRIQTSQNLCFKILCFPEVHYFNYSLLDTNGALKNESLEQVQEFYENLKVNKHKVLIPTERVSEFKSQKAAKRYTLVSSLIKAELKQKLKVKQDNRLDFIKVDGTSIEKFTEVYLKSFESETTDTAKVKANFNKLLPLKNIHLYLLFSNEEAVGVNVLYQDHNQYLLAGGAILPGFRNNNFHKTSLKFRINQAQNEYGTAGISAIAYKGSISLKNMIKLNMSAVTEYEVYEYCDGVS